MILFTCFFLELLAGMEVDLFVPSCCQLQACFGLSPFAVELTLGVNLFAYCIGAFVGSPLSDRYGKKNTVLFGCLLFILGSILCALSSDFTFLLVGRFIQGFGIAFPAVMAYVIIVNHYSVEQQTLFLGYLNGAITVGMMVAPILGAYLAHYFGWSGNFYALTIFGIVSYLMSWYCLPKDKGDDTALFDFSSFLPVITCPQTMICIFCMTFILQGFWIFTALSPLLYIDYYKIDLLTFGFYQGALSAAFAFFSVLGPAIIKKFGEKNAVFYSAKVMFFSGFCVAACLIFDLSPLWITISVSIHCASIAITMLILWPAVVNLKKNYKTQRSSIATAMRLIMTAVTVQIVSYFYKDVFFPIGIAIVVVSFLSYPLLIKTYKMLREPAEI
jgi:DHA1 family bicyclomycin/chloramphenicol resistance-like MFS transporter